jgi:RNA polymerase sigma-32 factor
MASEPAALSAYRAKLCSFSPLPEADERALALAWRQGDKKSGERLVCACLPFVASIAMEYRRWGVPLEDIIQQGNIGLLKAAERFDPARDCRLITYAAYWIRAEIRDYVVRAYRVVRFGTTKGERRALRYYRTTREDDPATLAHNAGLSEERVRQLLPLLTSVDASLDAESPSTGLTYLDRLESAEPSPEERAAQSEANAVAREAIDEALRELSPREQMIIQERWVRDEPLTLEHLGSRLGVSKERVRQLEERARAKLRARLERVHQAVALPAGKITVDPPRCYPPTPCVDRGGSDLALGSWSGWVGSCGLRCPLLRPPAPSRIPRPPRRSPLPRAPAPPPAPRAARSRPPPAPRPPSPATRLARSSTRLAPSSPRLPSPRSFARSRTP